MNIDLKALFTMAVIIWSSGRGTKRNKGSNNKISLLLVSAILLSSWMLQLSLAEKFEPYTLNGGLVSAVAGKNFCIAACDTRMIGEGGYILESRNHLSNRLWTVDDDTLMVEIEDTLRSDLDSPEVQEIEVQDTLSNRAPVLVGSSGCSTDCCQLQRTLRADFRAASYFGQITRSDPDQVANLLSQTLYERRGFPYYSFCVVSGLDKGQGKAYVYDAIGSYERVAVAAAGTGRELLQPILDRMFEAKTDNKMVDGTVSEAVETLCKAYRSVSEREIGVGDKLILHVSETVKDSDKVRRRVLVVPLKQH